MRICLWITSFVKKNSSTFLTKNSYFLLLYKLYKCGGEDSDNGDEECEDDNNDDEPNDEEINDHPD